MRRDVFSKIAALNNNNIDQYAPFRQILIYYQVQESAVGNSGIPTTVDLEVVNLSVAVLVLTNSLRIDVFS